MTMREHKSQRHNDARDYGCTSILFLWPARSFLFVRSYVDLFVFLFVSLTLRQIKSFFYLKRSESGWRLHARTLPQNEWGEVINDHWLYVYSCFFLLLLFLLLLLRILFLFSRYVLVSTEPTAAAAAEIVKCNDQNCNQTFRNRFDWSFRCAESVCSSRSNGVGKYALIIIPQQHSTDAANLVWHHIEFCAHSFSSFPFILFVLFSVRTREHNRCWTLLNIACPCVLVGCCVFASTAFATNI